MSVISAVQTFIKTYGSLKSGAPVWLSYLSEKPIEYSIVPLAGPQIVDEYIDGSTSREFPFALQSMESTIDELSRLNSHEFFEAFAEWLRTQSGLDTFSETLDMDEGQTPFKITALGHGALIQAGDSQTGIYQIQCKLEYEQTT